MLWHNRNIGFSKNLGSYLFISSYVALVPRIVPDL